MKTRLYPFCIAFLATILAPATLFACTNVIITRGASADTSTMVSYSADSHWMYGYLEYRKGGFWKKGSTRPVHCWENGKYLMDIPEVERSFQRTGNMNEKQVIIAESTYGGREELHTPGEGLDYGSLIYIALERASSAREAIDIIVSLADTYGYCDEGESFSIADKNEAWVMDLIGRGPGKKGIVYVARKIPDGYICAHANQSRISTFPLHDRKQCIYAPDVISLARDKGYFTGKDEDFSFCDAYNPLNFSGMRGCESRVWSAFNTLCDGIFCWEEESGKVVCRPAGDYLPYAMGRDSSLRMPLFVKPARKIGVKDLSEVMRDHFEGTPMDLTTDIGAGGNRCPYRWRPMGFEYEGHSYVNERAIATQQTAWWFVAQSRGNLPDTIGGLFWFGTDDAATSPLVPLYVCINDVPASFRQDNGSLTSYSPTSSFWINNRVANACYKMYDRMAPVVKAKIDSLENGAIEQVRDIDRQALELYKAAAGKHMSARGKNVTKSPYTACIRYLSDYSIGKADETFHLWVKLEEELLIRFIDGNEKTFKEDGTFELSWPGYSKKWKESVVKDNGGTLIIK